VIEHTFERALAAHRPTIPSARSPTSATSCGGWPPRGRTVTGVRRGETGRDGVAIRLARKDTRQRSPPSTTRHRRRGATFETEPRTAEQIATLLADKGERYPTVVVERDGRVIAWRARAYRPAGLRRVAEHSVYVARAARGPAPDRRR